MSGENPRGSLSVSTNSGGGSGLASPAFSPFPPASTNGRYRLNGGDVRGTGNSMSGNHNGGNTPVGTGADGEEGIEVKAPPPPVVYEDLKSWYFAQGPLPEGEIEVRSSSSPTAFIGARNPGSGTSWEGGLVSRSSRMGLNGNGGMNGGIGDGMSTSGVNNGVAGSGWMNGGNGSGGPAGVNKDYDEETEPFGEDRHVTTGVLTSNDEALSSVAEWRMKTRMKTSAVAMVVCLNIGVDPPDVVKIHPAAKNEAWIDPFDGSPDKTLDAITKALQGQYERWQPKAKYRACSDPTVDEVKKLACTVRRLAKEERVLFHYNGHGVPKPTANGEIWVFNKDFTQYIPLSLYDLQSWLGSPCLVVFECSGAGTAMSCFKQFIKQRAKELEAFNARASHTGSPANSPPPVGSTASRSGSPTTSTASSSSSSSTRSAPPKQLKDCILLGACAEDEVLPQNPDLPADLFTACLTTPIRTALKWFANHSLLKSSLDLELLDQIPGKLNDRRTPLGELNWIFTAITDTIAWNSLPPSIFQTLFRQDLLVASLFRNFLLAQRIMHSLGCTPQSEPKLPETHAHPLWASWDLAAEAMLSQLAGLLAPSPVPYVPSTFFAEQLTAFEVWLSASTGAAPSRPPQQLPIVLQVLLSQTHRLRALVLLARFLDLGPWAVNLALSVGIFPYVLKLLQSPSPDLRHVLLFIWAKILSIDRSCQADLIKDGGHMYFVTALSSRAPVHPLQHRLLAVFCLSALCDRFRSGQHACLHGGLLPQLIVALEDPHPLMRQWSAIALGKLWERYEDARAVAARDRALDALAVTIEDPCPDVRAASVYSGGLIIGSAVPGGPATAGDLAVLARLSVAASDSSPLVRKELLFTVARCISYHPHVWAPPARAWFADRARRKSGGVSGGALDSLDNSMVSNGSSVSNVSSPGDMVDATTKSARSLWKLVVGMRKDPFPAVSALASAIVARSMNIFQSSEPMPSAPPPSLEPNLFVGAGSAIPPVKRAQFPVHPLTRSTSSLSISSLTQSPLGLKLPNGSLLLADPVVMASEDGTPPVPEALLPPGPPPPQSAESEQADGSPLPGVVAAHPSVEAIRETKAPFGRRSGLASAVLRRARSGPIAGPGVAESPSSPSMLNERGDVGNGHANGNAGGRHTSLDHSFAVRASANGSPSGLNSDTASTNSTVSSNVSGSIPSDQCNSQKVTSSFFAWSRSFWAQPLTRPRLHKDVGSDYWLDRQWKSKRNAAAAGRAASLYPSAGKRPVREAAAVLDVPRGGTPVALAFHTHEDQINVADSLGAVTSWNWVEGSTVGRLSLGRSGRGTAVVDVVDVIREDSTPLLVVGSRDGVIRVYRDVGVHADLVSAWRAIPAVPRGQGARMVLSWQPRARHLLVGGGRSSVRVWDVEREAAVQDLVLGTSGSVSAVDSSGAMDNMFVVGATDGSVRLFDRRAGSSYGPVVSWQEHGAGVIAVNAQRGGGRMIVSAAASGMVKLWDVRAGSAVRSIVAVEEGQLSCLDVHEYAPVVAAGSSSGFVQVFNDTGEVLSTLRHTDGFLGSTLGSVRAVRWHPQRMVLAVAEAGDSIVRLYCQSSGNTASGQLVPGPQVQ